MGQKQVRVCDRCEKEQEFFSTTKWTTVQIIRAAFVGEEDTKAFDLCDKCTEVLESLIKDNDS